MSAPAPPKSASGPPKKFTPASLAGVSEEDEFPVSIEESRSQIINKFDRSHVATLTQNGASLGFFCCNNSIVARLQQGPTCGLVSLRMAAESIVSSSQEGKSGAKGVSLLQLAKEKGYTGFGEMFSAVEMAELADTYYEGQLKTEVWDGAWTNDFVVRLFETLCAGGITLVPYDVDKNHEPCCAGGKKAHWTAIKGFLVPIKTNKHLDFIKVLHSSLSIIEQHTLPSGPQLHLYQPSLRNEPLDAIVVAHLARQIAEDISTDQIRLIAQQSKSKHQAIWTFDSLARSNDNLQHFDEDRITSPEFKVPDVLDGLRLKVVFLTPP